MQDSQQSARENVVVYARVSSKEQEREGFSIPAQLELLRTYAKQHGMIILQEFVDAESASGGAARVGFGEMLAFLRANRGRCKSILVEKTDRLYRNLRDYVKVDELGPAIHFVKEGSVLSPDSRSSEQLVHGIKVLMARNYSLNLGEETLKGMRQKAKSGLYPSCAPAGYRNVEGSRGKRIIVPTGDAPIIARLFDEFATGHFSLKALARKARTEGWTVLGRPLARSTLHQILRRRIYCGDFDWDGTAHTGTHDALVSREIWDRVQLLLGRRAETKLHRIKHDFAFTGFVRCGHCGCCLVGELKKKRYVYYHCTGHRGKCPEPYAREEAIQSQFADSLRTLVVPLAVLHWLEGAVAESDVNARSMREREANRLEEQCRRVEMKLERLYEDRLEDRITAEVHDRKARDLRLQRLDFLRHINEIQATAPAPVQQAISLMDLTSKAADLFAVQPPHEKQGFLRLVLKAASWRDGRLHMEFEEPFESMKRSNHASQSKLKEVAMANRDFEDWLPGMDSNHDSRLQRPLSYH